MADKTITQLTAAAALAGTEVLPVVQSGATKKVTVDQILTPAAGKGIDFSANGHAAGMTSELLNDYEEGAFTPVLTVASGSITQAVVAVPHYTKIGRLVNASGYINVSAVSTPSGALAITDLPYPALGFSAVALTLFTGGFTQAYAGYMSPNSTTINIPNLNANIMVGGENVMFNATYVV